MADHFNISDRPKRVQVTNPANARPVSSDDDVGYISRIFVQALFPYRKSDDLKRSITQGNLQITLSSPEGLPYGKYPRLIMAYIVTLAAKQARQAQQGMITEEQARCISMGHSLNEFLRQIGAASRGSGGTRGTVTLIREQLDRLMTSSIIVRKLTERRSQGANGSIADSWDLWFGTRNPDQGAFQQSYVVLSEAFYNEIRNAPIPIDLNVLRNLSRPRAIDLYFWITLKKYWIIKRGLTQFTFTWPDMEAHFSPTPLTTSTQRRDFRNEIKTCLKAIEEDWQDVGVEIDTYAGGNHQGWVPPLSR